MSDLPALRVAALGYRYRGAATPALMDVDLSVGAGGFVALVGPSGCGKSSLLRLAAGLLTPTSGAIEVLGGPPAVAGAAKRIGFAPQSPALLPWASTRDNVALPLRVNRDARRPGLDPDELIERVGLGAFAEERPGALSGGMAQRVAVARALVTDPDLLLMDEPFAALDELTREALRDDLAALFVERGPAVVWVTHSVTEALVLADRVVVLSARPGRVVADVAVELPRVGRAGLTRDPTWLAAEDAVRAALGLRVAS